MSDSKITVGVVGGTGYTGVELLRLLCHHPDAVVTQITSRSEKGRQVSDLFPSLRGYLDLAFTEPDPAQLSRCDVVFFATPHGVAMSMAPEIVEAGAKVIDLGADFRIKDIAIWESWYGMKHTSPQYVDEAVYGLPEVNREAIKKARLIACPGCYPTAVQLGFLPLLRAGLINPGQLIADAKSGVSGAGRQANVSTLLCEASESFKAYGVAGHRHLPEISQGLTLMTNNPVKLTFVPHLTPMIRGIHATLYGQLLDSDPVTDFQTLFEEAFNAEPFMDVLPAGSHPETRSVRSNNHCQIAVHRPQGGNTVVVLSVIDNLVKGAAGQAIQNMNLLFGKDETTGLRHPALLP